MAGIAAYQRALEREESKLRLMLASGKGSAFEIALQRVRCEILRYEIGFPGSVLVFDKIGGDYFLRQVLGGSAGAVNVSLPLSASEERVRKQESHAKNINQISIQGIAGD